jgi:uncharacterized damage-inducible protein DinB
MKPPVTSDLLAILRAHNHWATRRVLDLCRPLTPDQFHQRFDIGPGSLHNALTHIVSCMRHWADRIANRTLRPPLEPHRHTADDLARLLDESDADLSNLIESARPDLSRPVETTVGQKRYTFTTGAALTDIFVHGAHHRAQCLNMLRRLSVQGLSDRLPDLDVTDWQYETECKP